MLEENLHSFIGNYIFLMNFRNDSGVGRFGSSHTLDSDCSSMQSGRRPSLDTISTYLSQDSCNVEDDASHMTRFHNHDESK